MGLLPSGSPFFLKSNEVGEIKSWNEARRADLVYKLALLGATDQQMADVMGVDINTFNYWKRTKPDFLEALEKGKDLANAEVASALYKCCVGYYYEEDHVSNYKGDVVVTRVQRYKGPNPWAIMKWLSMRKPEHWRESLKNELTQNNINITKFDLKDMDEEDRALLKRLALKQIAQNIGDG